MYKTISLARKSCYSCGNKVLPLPTSKDDMTPFDYYAVHIDSDGDVYCNQCKKTDEFSSDYPGDFTWILPTTPKNDLRPDGRYYKFIHREENGRLYSEYGQQDWEIGQKVTLDGKPSLCNHGFHASPHMFKAHSNVSTDWLALVTLDGEYDDDETKTCALECTVDTLLHITPEWCKKVVLRLYDTMPDSLSRYEKQAVEPYTQETAYVDMHILRGIRSGISYEHEEWFDGILLEMIDTIKPYDPDAPEEVRSRILRQARDLQENVSYVASDIEYHVGYLKNQQAKLETLNHKFTSLLSDLAKLD